MSRKKLIDEVKYGPKGPPAPWAPPPIAEKLDPTFPEGARRFAVAVNAASRAASASQAAPTAAPAVDRSPTELLAELAKQRGGHHPTEFDAKKTEILGRI